jgi:TP901-1 family phage major tail protein
MAGQRGRDMLLKLSEGGSPETFVTIAGLRARAISLNAQAVDATSAESPAAWRELLGGAGVKSASVTGVGIFKDSLSDMQIRAAFFAQETRRWRLVVPDFGELTGPFLIEQLDYSGEHDGEAAFAIKLASAGELVFAAL